MPNKQQSVIVQTRVKHIYTTKTNKIYVVFMYYYLNTKGD